MIRTEGYEMSKDGKTAHTPGPWDLNPRWSEEDDQISIFASPLDMGIGQGISHEGLIASIHPDDLDEGFDEAESNAHLITAAPDMLSALLPVKRARSRVITRGMNKTTEYVVVLTQEENEAACAAIAKAKGS